MIKGQATIGIHKAKYNKLAKIKAELEATVGKEFDWGTFLLILAGLRIPELEDEKMLELNDSSGEGVTDEELAEAGFEEIPSWVSREEVEEIVNKATEKILKELAVKRS